MRLSNNIPSSFISNLKLGDNISYNISFLSELYTIGNLENPKYLKFGIVSQVSIIEAVMIDFIRRVKIHTREFQYFDEKTRASIRKLKSDNAHWKLDDSIKKFRHFRIVGKSEHIYEDLFYFKDLRNKIHIHNFKFDKNELHIWNEANLKKAERLTEYILKYLYINYPRPLKEDFVGGFMLPWSPYVANDELVYLT